MKHKRIRSETGFMKLLPQFVAGDWVFRGVRQASYELVPKIGRPESGYYHRDLEKTLFYKFRNQAAAYVSAKPKNDLEWLVLAQHHGLPTRLLDWTENLAASAYFAVEIEGRKGDAAIYATKLPREIQTSEFIATKGIFKIDEVTVFYSPSVSSRITAQRALFTAHPLPTEAYRPDELIKISISKEFCVQLKLLLDQLGVCRATLFPDLDGTCETLAWHHRITKAP